MAGKKESVLTVGDQAAAQLGLLGIHDIALLGSGGSYVVCLIQDQQIEGLATGVHFL
jgi:hypothetical protein